MYDVLDRAYMQFSEDRGRVIEIVKDIQPHHLDEEDSNGPYYRGNPNPNGPVYRGNF
mgnify:CR=1 FL=1